jgi:hypothetical protein
VGSSRGATTGIGSLPHEDVDDALCLLGVPIWSLPTFGPVLSELADRLRTEHGWADVEVEVLDATRHYLVEERPEAVTRLIERCAS